METFEQFVSKAAHAEATHPPHVQLQATMPNLY